MIEEMPIVTYKTRKNHFGRTIKEEISLTELIYNGEMPRDVNKYQGICDDIPWPFRELKELGVEIVPITETIGNRTEKKLYYKYLNKLYPI